MHMKILSILLTLAVSFPAFGKRSSPEPLMLDDEPCLPELLPSPGPEGYKRDLNNLIITFENEIYWKGKRVILSHVDGPNIRTNTAPLNLLLAMTKNPYQVLSAADLFKATWAKSKRQDLKALVREEMVFVRQGFLKVDPDFDAVKTWWGRGFSWDDGEFKVLEKFYDVPELLLTNAGYTWNGELVKLNAQGKKLLEVLLRFRSFGVPNRELVELLVTARKRGNSYLDPAKQLADAILSIRKAFVAVDPTFDRLETTRGDSHMWVIRSSHN
jgi:DNA-binding winged helix-turn-helix (wHTH) protein